MFRRILYTLPGTFGEKDVFTAVNLGAIEFLPPRQRQSVNLNIFSHPPLPKRKTWTTIKW
jgi:hypothetical protein